MAVKAAVPAASFAPAAPHVTVADPAMIIIALCWSVASVDSPSSVISRHWLQRCTKSLFDQMVNLQTLYNETTAVDIQLN